MIAVDFADVVEALAPGLVTLGLCKAVVPWLDRRSTVGRAVMIVPTLAAALYYFVWRVTQTLPPLDTSVQGLLGRLFVAFEAASVLGGMLSLLLLLRTRDRTGEADRHLHWYTDDEAPLVDVLICTYNEEEAILERTIVGALAMDYPNYRTWVLDDGRRPWLAELCARLGCGYLTRPDNAHAKAGNINHALGRLAALAAPPDFVSVLDADFVATPTFLRRAMALFHADDVGIVQTPQHFINPDPIQTNLSIARVWPDDQRYFFDILMASKDAWGTAFCCGTSSVVRFRPLMAIGGFPTDSVTEDYLLTLRLKETGQRTVYLNEPLTLGLAPEGLKEYLTQRGRWCLGFMQIARGSSGPLSMRSRLGLVDRLALVDAFLNWAAVYPMKVACLLIPVLYLLFDVRLFIADTDVALRHFLPLYVLQTATMAWISSGRVLPVISDVCQYIAAPAVIRAVFVGLLRPRGHAFAVTAKGGDRSRGFVEWPLMRIYGALLALAAGSIVASFYLSDSGESIIHGSLALAWTWYNLFVLTIVCLACIELPRHRKAERFASDEPAILDCLGRRAVWRMTDISISGARFSGPAPASVGAPLACTLRGRTIGATVVRILPEGFAVRFVEDEGSRAAMIRHFYAGSYVRSFDQIRAGRVGRALLKKMLS